MSTIAVRGSRKTQVKEPKANGRGGQINAPPQLVDKTCPMCEGQFSLWLAPGDPGRNLCFECDPEPGGRATNGEPVEDSFDEIGRKTCDECCNPYDPALVACPDCFPQGRKRKSKLTSKAAAASAATKKTVDGSAEKGLIEISVDVRKIEIVEQARKDFDQAKIDALAESIERDGLLQPPVVRHNPGNAAQPYRLVAGERRMRAVKKLGWSSVPVRLASGAIDDAQALLMQGEENVLREQFNDVELADWYRRMTTPTDEGGGGYTQDALAKRLGTTQGEISNTIRLLRCPEWARELVIARKMSASHALHLVAFADCPPVLAAIEKATKGMVGPKANGLGTKDDYGARIQRIAFNSTVPLEDDDYRYELGGSIRFAISKEDRAKLVTVKVKTYGGEEERAVDVKAAKKLLEAAKREALAKAEAKKKGKGKQAGGPEKKLSPAEQRKRDAQLEQQFKNRVESWFYDWLRVLCADRIEHFDGTTPSYWLTLWALIAQPADEQEIYDLFFAAIDKGPERGAFDRAAALELIASLSAGETNAGLKSLAIGLLIDAEGQPRQPSYGCEYLRSDVVAALARLLNLDIAAAWRDDRRSAMRQKYWELHSKEQLLELGGELKVPLLETQKKSVMVNLLLGQEKPLPLPKTLAGLVGKVAGGKQAKKKGTRSRGGAD